LFADSLSQVVELGAADIASLFKDNFVNHGSVDWPDSFYANGHMGEFADPKGLACAPTSNSHENAFKDLETGFLILDYLLVNGDGVADAKNLIGVS